MKLIRAKFSKRHYINEKQNKDTIVLHHTVSYQGSVGDINWWKSTKERVATCVIIDHDGDINLLFPSDKWAHHLGIKSIDFKRNDINPMASRLESRNTLLNKKSIGIEIDSLGGLTKKGDLLLDAYGNPFHGEFVYYPEGYRNFFYYEKYNSNQIQALKVLIKYYCKKYKIPTRYNTDMFRVSKDALMGSPGIWSHTSYRLDKSDIHPQKELIEMLKSLEC